MNVHKAMESTPLKLILRESRPRRWGIIAVNLGVVSFQKLVHGMAPLLLGDGDSVGKVNKAVVFLNPSPRLVRWLLLLENAPITESTKAEETRFV